MDVPVIINDSGGYVWAHEALGQLYAERGSKLQVIYCASACLDLIARIPKENLCFTRAAWIGYHTKNDHGLTYKMRWERGTDWIARGYRQCLPGHQG